MHRLRGGKDDGGDAVAQRTATATTATAPSATTMTGPKANGASKAIEHDEGGDREEGGLPEAGRHDRHGVAT